MEEGNRAPSRSRAGRGQALAIGEEIDPAELQAAVEATHGATATLRDMVPVRETFQGETAWEGYVHVFALQGHPSADTAYAWSSPVEGSEPRRSYAVPHTSPMDSPAAAVCAAIVSDYRVG